MSVDDFIPSMTVNSVCDLQNQIFSKYDSPEFRMIWWRDLHRNGSEMIQMSCVLSDSGLDVFGSREVSGRQLGVLFLMGRGASH